MRDNLAQSAIEGQQPALLVIDDDVIQRTILTRLSAQAGFSVTAAASLQEASQALSQSRFDCVTLDLSLGQESGALLLDTMVRTHNKVPVIIISGAEEFVMKATQEIAEKLGLDPVLFKKPLKLADIRETLTHKAQGAQAVRALNTIREALDETALQ